MPLSVEQICDTIAERKLLPSAEVSRLRARWFKPGRADANDVDKFGHWLSVNNFLTPFAFRMLRDWKADLLQLNQYQLTDHLASGPFAGAYLALDPLRRPVVLEVLAADRANDPEAVKAFQIAAEKARSVRQANVNLTLDFGEAKGWHYLVREFDEGETLAEILARRGRLPPTSAARLFALALLGLHALHESQVPAGPLGAESLLLTVAGKTAGKARTVKILNAGVPRSLFDPAAFDAGTTAAAPLIHSNTATISDPREDIFRLGASFYRSLTGQPPFPTESAAAGGHRATPIRQLAPDVPELLAQDVESMIDPNAAQRPASAARAAKALRVFLASEEESEPSHPEEHLVPHPHAVAPSPAEEMADATAPTESTAEAQRAEGGEVTQQLRRLWEELRPGQRDWVFLSIGAAGVILIVLFFAVLTGIKFVNVVCLLAGGALSFFVERLLRLREEQAE
jgi:serine/threonine protein kinase